MSGDDRGADAMSDQPSDHDLEATFRARVQASAEQINATPDESDLAARITTADRRRRLAVLVAAASILAVLGAAALIAPRLSSQASRVRTGTDAPSTTPPAPATPAPAPTRHYTTSTTPPAIAAPTTVTEPSTTTTPPSTAPPTSTADQCAAPLSADAAAALIGAQPDGFTTVGASWVPNMASFDPSQELSGVVALPTGATRNSPVQLFLFHFGCYAGTALPHAFFAVKLNRIDAATLSLSFDEYTKHDAACCPSLPPYTVRFQWNGTTVVPLDPLPAIGQGMW